jgi:hypothetical protein
MKITSDGKYYIFEALKKCEKIAVKFKVDKDLKGLYNISIKRIYERALLCNKNKTDMRG